MGQQHAGGGRPHLPEWLADGGERRLGVGCRRDVVESDDCNVVRNQASQLTRGLHGADRGEVIVGEDGVELDAGGDRLLDRVPAAVEGEITLDDEAFVQMDAELVIDGAEAVQAFLSAAEVFDPGDYQWSGAPETDEVPGDQL